MIYLLLSSLYWCTIAHFEIYGTTGVKFLRLQMIDVHRGNNRRWVRRKQQQLLLEHAVHLYATSVIGRAEGRHNRACARSSSHSYDRTKLNGFKGRGQWTLAVLYFWCVVKLCSRSAIITCIKTQTSTCVKIHLWYI